MLKLGWDTTNTPANLQTALRTLAEEYPLVENGPGDLQVQFKAITASARTFRIVPQQTTVIVEYSDLAAALRAVGSLLAGVKTGREQTSFTTFGIMLDCSRNAVMTVEHFKGWLRKLALLGYNLAMLYTEDTYQIDGEPYFGYQRGAYTAEELGRIDAYAASLGMELIGCVQTLGHLAQILKWSAYRDVLDTPSVLLVGEDKTYALIEKMIKTFAETCRSRRIHIGMDETHDLGRGRYLDLCGYQRGFDLFNEHLARVTALCEKHGLKPMIWSDMYFRLGSKEQDYYDHDCVIPDDVKSKIPTDVQLVYWDYYHDTEAFYVDWIDRHRALGFEPVMGSGVWTWLHFWYGRDRTQRTAGPCIAACRKAGVKEIFFTLWGDDGAYCDFDSALAGLTWTAELGYTGAADETAVEKRFAAVCRGHYPTVMRAADLSWPGAPGEDVCGSELLWDDPLLGIFCRNQALKNPAFFTEAIARYQTLAQDLDRPCDHNPVAGDLVYARALARLLASKLQARYRLETAYARKDKTALETLAADLPQVIERLEHLGEAFRVQWLRRNKPQGLEVIQIRLGGLRQRYLETATRIREFCRGKIARIEELEDLPTVPLARTSHRYTSLATASSIF